MPISENGPIQTQAPGLLELLQIKNRGQLPRFLIDNVSPMIDMLEFYLQAPITTETNNTLTAAQSVITVMSAFSNLTNAPYYVHNYSLRLPIGAATTDVAAMCLTLIEPVTTGVGHVIAEKTYETPIAGQSRFVSLHAERFWLPPGAALGALVGTVIAGTALQANFTLRYLKLDTN